MEDDQILVQEIKQFVFFKFVYLFFSLSIITIIILHDTLDCLTKNLPFYLEDLNDASHLYHTKIAIVYVFP